VQNDCSENCAVIMHIECFVFASGCEISPAAWLWLCMSGAVGGNICGAFGGNICGALGGTACDTAALNCVAQLNVAAGSCLENIDTKQYTRTRID